MISIKTKRYIFTENGFIVFNPTGELETSRSASGKIAFYPPTTDPNIICQVFWSNIVYESDSLYIIEEFALHYFEEHQDKINCFIKKLGGKVNQRSIPKMEYLKMLLRYNLMEWFIEKDDKELFQEKKKEKMLNM